ncbi:PREDICTED: uncharacterized protein LOC108557596 [Nicrophorus vespilloides]|uniref:Uncharacterized protein LOC108557596 n=1 Tax=Nicrophorus vespilloides TaxID=110193 RepID=A0ABM1M522_NICVS|nr:PREDICTED: uncharacterized protein LOC108557596 [Nicrophorus vespilloides]
MFALLFVLQSTVSGYSYEPFVLPEIIVNKANEYNYPIPSPPILFDEPFTTTTTTENPGYLPPPSYLPPSTSYGVPESKSFRVLNMSCLDSGNDRFFRSSLRFGEGNVPIPENGNQDCVLSSGGGIYQVNLSGQRMTKCGVSYCSDRNLCMQLRMPTVRGIKLPEDAVINLQCKPQNSVASQIKHLQFRPINLQGRSLRTVAAGGSQRNLESQVALYRKAPHTNEYTQIVTPGSSVTLGEDLLLRASVRDGDGWKYSRMGTVIVHGRQSSPDSITLVDNSGCRAHNMRAVCPEQPKQVDSLVTTMPLRAFMFQGAQQGDEMRLSVRVHACLQLEDCIQARHCEEKVDARTRSRREAVTNITDGESYLDFRVVLPDSKSIQSNGEDSVLLVTVLFFVVFAAVLIIAALLIALLKSNNYFYC